ncbi:MAG: class I SAM-dependent methyltransferase [Anaerolineales bacterium]|jgi:ubiquinone/menaquinone biosynthesis C-methylase UbiE
MSEKILTTSAAQKFYDRIGSRYDWFEFYEGQAKEQAFNTLQLVPGLNVLSVGAGTGKELARIQSTIRPGGIAFGLDLSPVMAKLARERTGASICQADARCLPYRGQAFDRLYASYILDLLPLADIGRLLHDFHRVLRSGGKLVILALTEGVDLPSRTLVSLWKGLFSISPAACGGCRPLKLQNHVQETGFSMVKRQVIVQAGVPSELISAQKTKD